MKQRKQQLVKKKTLILSSAKHTS